jgi:hypothetical protein
MNQIPYIINTFRGGISDENSKGIPGSFKFGKNLDIHKRDDSLTCKQKPMITWDSPDLVKWFVPATDGSLYAFCANGSIYARTGGTGDWNGVYNDENGDIRGAVEWKTDDGDNYMYWATSTSIARKAFPGNGSLPWTDAIQDWKTLLDPYPWHTMKISSGDMMVANGPYLASYTYEEVYDSGIMSIRPGNSIKALEERDDYVIMGSYRNDNAEEGHLWNWISGVVQKYIQKKKVPTQGINALITTEVPLCQAGFDGQLYYSDFESMIPLIQIPGGGQCYPGATDIEDGLALFGMFGGTNAGIWSYGRKAKNRSLVPNYEYTMTGTLGGTTSTIGAIAVQNGKTFVSWGAPTEAGGSRYCVEEVSSTLKANAVYEGLEFNAGRPYWKKQVDTVKFTMSPMPTGTSVSCKFKFDKESDWRYAILGDNTTTFSVPNAVEVEFNIGKQGVIYEIGAELNPYGNETPEILSITSYLSPQGYEHQ